ncbi:hypothetical protein CHH83_03450 [Bacillus sp. 7586-K]|nr:hypothetical protein CHH83_03450 [Bacillus sp. 7586-K]
MNCNDSFHKENCKIRLKTGHFDDNIKIPKKYHYCPTSSLEALILYIFKGKGLLALTKYNNF